MNYNKALKERQASTGSWLVTSKQYADWKRNRNSFLWLYGIPGCGKTVLSSSVVEDVTHYCHSNSTTAESKPIRALAYFYFDFNDEWKQRCEGMIRSLIVQLSTQCKATLLALQSLYSSSANGSQQPSTDALLQTLRELINNFDETFIVLDALDECKERPGLLEYIDEIVSWKVGKLHVLATSRREKDIEDSFESFLESDGKVSLQTAMVDHDIRTYINDRLRTDRKMRRWQKHPNVLEEIETKLMEKANGM
jgi:Cdc6-like AAA superfamily ATPase